MKLTTPSIEFSIGTTPQSTLAGGDGVEHVGHGAGWHELAGGEVGLRAQRLLGERAERPEEADPERCHGVAGYGGRAIRQRIAPDAGPGSMVGVDEAALRELLDDVAAGRVDADEVVAALRRLPFADLGDALVDHHRALRQGMPEAVYGPGKTPEQCARIVGELLAHGTGPVLLTRAIRRPGQGGRRRARPPALQPGRCLLYRRTDADARPATSSSSPPAPPTGPVADECVAHPRRLRVRPDRLDDVGVAGLHRLLAHLDTVTAADAVVVIAGMEGALASVVGGLTGAPVVAVPTSVGYGASFEGVTALLAMLASCASGVTVVGIDNGFGAACAVARMLP